MSKSNKHYWYDLWYEDVELHKKLYIKDVKKIDNDNPENMVDGNEHLSDSVSVYGDSICGSSTIITNIGEYTIEELYNKHNNTTIKDGKEVVSVNFKSLNWTKEENIHYSNVKNIIRHKTTKKKWKLKGGGKEIIITGDHSIIVFRNNKKIKIKPSEVKKSDKILIYKRK